MTKLTITNIKWAPEENADMFLPQTIEVDVKSIIHNYSGNPNQDLDLESAVRNWLINSYCWCHDFTIEPTNICNAKGHYHISYFWRGDNEDTEYYSFDTKEHAWEFVKSEIEKRIEAFKNDEEQNGKTKIDFEQVKKDLFEKGFTDKVNYCQCHSWWDNWSYWYK